jgi:hypothetical protein
VFEYVSLAVSVSALLLFAWARPVTAAEVECGQTGASQSIPDVTNLQVNGSSCLGAVRSWLDSHVTDVCGWCSCDFCTRCDRTIVMEGESIEIDCASDCTPVPPATACGFVTTVGFKWWVRCAECP